MLPIPSSITHQHLLSVINTLLDKKQYGSVVRILDVGCGDGKLIAYLLKSLPILRPDLQFWIGGLDVEDEHVQEANYAQNTVKLLNKEFPSIEWASQVSFISSTDLWPIDSDSLDFIISNQVLEHVRNHEFLLRQTKRCLKSDGTSVNLFPLLEILWEGHACMPLVHRIRDQEKRRKWMLFFAKVGFQKHFKRDMIRYGWKSLEEFAEVFSSVLQRDTNYLTAKQFQKLGDKTGLEVSFMYTKNFFTSKLLSLVGIRKYTYSYNPFIDKVGSYLGRYLSSSTMLLSKQS